MIDELFRKDLAEFSPYKAEIKKARVVLDANESFLNIPANLQEELLAEIRGIDYNRYPDPFSIKLCEEFLRYIGQEYLGSGDLGTEYLGIDIKNIIAGNGSDELISMIISAFAQQGDKVLIPTPNFSMYKIYSKVSGAIPVEYPTSEEFKLDVNNFIAKVNEEKAKIVFISNPNNPTGGVIPLYELIKIIDGCNSIVVIDEAYGEFYGKTLVDKILRFDNLIILKTCSKMGMAAIRLGFLLTNERLMEEIKKVKPPYNLNSVTQTIGYFMLYHREAIKDAVNKIILEREYLYKELSAINLITIFPSQANFILIKVPEADKTYEMLLQNNVSVRNFKDDLLKDYFRITVGSRAENFWFISHLKSILKQIAEGK
ncbi:MAG TPA: histidinol-phosphate transaminase [Clostridiaceae bacterium]